MISTKYFYLQITLHDTMAAISTIQAVSWKTIIPFRLFKSNCAISNSINTKRKEVAETLKTDFEKCYKLTIFNFTSVLEAKAIRTVSL